MTDIRPVSEENADLAYITRACEAVLFACGCAVPFDRIALAAGVSPEEIPPALEALKKEYASHFSAIELVLYQDSAQLVTKSEYGEIVRTALELRKNQPLSRAALEVLAVVAYNQPVTRAFIDKVRGVESPSVTASLAEKGLIEEVGRLDAPGHPILYGTTPVFLRTFGLSSIEELGTLPELEEVQRAFMKEGEQMEMDIGDGALRQEVEEDEGASAPSPDGENSDVSQDVTDDLPEGEE